MQQRDMYRQLAAEREQKIQQLGGTTRSAEEVKSELDRRDEEKKKLEKDLEMYVALCTRMSGYWYIILPGFFFSPSCAPIPITLSLSVLSCYHLFPCFSFELSGLLISVLPPLRVILIVFLRTTVCRLRTRRLCDCTRRRWLISRRFVPP